MNPPRALKAAAWIAGAIALTAAVYFAAIRAEQFTFFNIERIEVRGNVYTSQAEITEAMAVVEGEGLFSTAIGEVTRRVERLPWVRHAGVFRRLPDTLILEVREWKPQYIIDLDKLYYMTAEGHVVDAPLDSGLDLPVINGISWAQLEAPGPDRDQLMRVLTLLDRGMFEGRIDEIHYDQTNGLTLYGEAPHAVGLFLGKTDIEERFRRYSDMKISLERRGQYAVTADMAYKDRIVAKLKPLAKRGERR
jgi:cell division septal protein FtsQ